jgi:hypothetical protein
MANRAALEILKLWIYHHAGLAAIENYRMGGDPKLRQVGHRSGNNGLKKISYRPIL